MSEPHLIQFPKIGAPDIGYISVWEQQKLIPFEIRRAFWIYYTPESVLRGRHAHYQTEQVLIALSGRIIVNTESAEGELQVFQLEQPSYGLYIPPSVWHTIQYSHTANQLVFASTLYDEHDYIRDLDQFKIVWGKQQS